ncbi:MAG: TetR/AcrR family transcriptional regulator [Archangium sp.]|nr:TetR/AcrR family transcriptional regulator [Archangium sp.]
MLLDADDQGTHGLVRDKQREETRKKLYHAAIEIFCRDGVANCRIEDIALKAEVSRAAFYFHFPSKDDVLLELLREAETPSLEAINALPPDAPLQSVFDALIQNTAAFWSAENRNRLLVDMFGVSMRRTTILADREAEVIRAAVSKRFEFAAGKGELSPVIPPEVLADFYLLNIFAAMASWCVQPIMPLADMLSGVTVLFMNGASNPAGSPFQKA